MNISKAIDALKTLLLNMKNKTQEECLVSYSIIMSILQGLDELAETEANTVMYGEYRLKIVYHCEAICGLDDGNSHDKQSHIVWALGEIGKLKSVHCFNV